VFESPLRLHLQLVCNANTPVKKMLDVWPCAFPIVIGSQRSLGGGANIIAALEHHDRVSKIDLYITRSTVLKRLYKVMKKPYPVLTRLCLHISKSTPVAPDTFLGRSAPCLEYLSFVRVPFPALPKYLPFFHDLVAVQLRKIPNTGYISPEAMATALSALTRLQVVAIGFESPASRPDPRNKLPSSLTRVVLPALTRLEFHGASEYLEDLVARIDTPATITVQSWFFNRLDFDIPHFVQFIGRTQIPGSFEEAMLSFDKEGVYVRIGHRDSSALTITISCHAFDWQVWCLAQICGKISPFLSNVERLLIEATRRATNKVFPDWKDYVDNPQWLEIFRAFSALQHVEIPLKLGEIIGSALQELTGERVMDALPMLRHLYLHPRSASIQQAIQPFISSRQLSNRPVTVHLTEMS
jgi:hypothetical protein